MHTNFDSIECSWRCVHAGQTSRQFDPAHFCGVRTGDILRLAVVCAKPFTAIFCIVPRPVHHFARTPSSRRPCGDVNRRPTACQSTLFSNQNISKAKMRFVRHARSLVAHGAWRSFASTAGSGGKGDGLNKHSKRLTQELSQVNQLAACLFPLRAPACMHMNTCEPHYERRPVHIHAPLHACLHVYIIRARNT